MQKDWSELDVRARAVLAAHDGVAHVSAFDEAGITRSQIGALRGRKIIERPRIGWYVDPELPWQVKVATRVGGPAACVTAADLRGLPVPPTDGRELHVHVDAHEGRLRHNRDRAWVLASVKDDHEVRLHRVTLQERPRYGLTGLLDTLLMMVGCVSTEWLVAALDAALHQPRDGRPLLDGEVFARLALLLPKDVLDLVDPLAESCLETLLRLGMLGRGITGVIAQAVPHHGLSRRFPAARLADRRSGRGSVPRSGAGPDP